jgi:phage tail tape-measure protein
MAERLTVGVAARLSRYLQVLTQARKMGKDRISSQEISEYTNINATQIRRDLSAFGRFGKRGVGYRTDALLDEIRKILRTQGQHNIALVGVGRLGSAIASSPIFAEHGITVAAIFENDPEKVDLPRSEHHRRSHRSACGKRARRCGRPGGRRGEDSVQLLGGSARHAERRPGPHVEPRRRVALRPLFPSDLMGSI